MNDDFAARYPDLPPVEGMVGMEAEKAQRAVLALSELRGWAIVCPREERDWLFQRIDAVLDAFGERVKGAVQRAVADAMEGVTNKREGEP